MKTSVIEVGGMPSALGSHGVEKQIGTRAPRAPGPASLEQSEPAAVAS